MKQSSAPTTTIDSEELAKFSRQAAQWWDENGPHRPLHQINPVRIRFIRDTIVQLCPVDSCEHSPFKALNILDVGCGGGLVTEPLARLGARVSGIDASQEAINVARQHAQAMGLNIKYTCATIEELIDQSEQQFDIVLALEIVEHVAQFEHFLAHCCRLVKPSGALIISTINRTFRSFALAIVTAEYLLRWLPQGTHKWEQFLTPAEISRPLQLNGFKVIDLKGLQYSPWAKQWQLTTNLHVNYFLTAVSL